jgi:hypothetical protein
MNINVKLKRKFRIGDKEYNSIEEMPADVRETFERAMVSQTGSEDMISRTSMRTKIIFNGIGYESIDAMPKDIRELYEKVLKAAETGNAPPNIDITKISSDILKEIKGPDITPSGDIHKPIKAEPSFSMKTLIIGILMAALIFLLYYLYYLSHGK